jgi:lipopolysaccharide heptosyltransferase III
MMTVLERLPTGSRAVVIRLRSLGDCVLTTPALGLLKACRPDIEIGVVVEERFAAVFEGNPDVARILHPRIGEVARWKPSLAVNLHGGTRSIVLTVASRARLRAGFAHHRVQSAYNIRIPRAQEILKVDRTVHTAEHLASAMFFLGVPLAEVPRARLYAAPLGRPRAYAVLHPFASAPGKTWPASHFLALARHLRDRDGMDAVFLAGPDDDPAPFAEFEVAHGRPLSEVKSILKSAAVFLGNDSGPAHMAAAFGIPSIVIFGASDPVVWAPWKTPAQVLALAGQDSCPISVDDVLAAVERLKVRV